MIRAGARGEGEKISFPVFESISRYEIMSHSAMSYEK